MARLGVCGAQMFRQGQRRKNTPIFRHVTYSAPHDPVGLFASNVDTAVADRTTTRRSVAEYAAQRRGLADTVAAEQRNALSPRHRETDALQHVAVAAESVDVDDLKHATSPDTPRGHGRCFGRCPANRRRAPCRSSARWWRRGNSYSDGYLAPSTPSQFYIGVEKPMGVYTWDNLIFTNAKVKDEVVYKMIDAMVKNKDDMIAVQPALRGFKWKRCIRNSARHTILAR